jgi:hypothetical protein
MADEGSDRRYTEREFNLILRTAIELDTARAETHGRPPPPVPSAEGLTLSEIQSIAREVGVDPARILEAADALDAKAWSLPARIFGGPAMVTLKGRFPRQLSTEQMGRLLEVARDTFRTQGEAHEVLGGVEWRTATRFSPISLRISPEAGETRLEIEVDRRSSAFLIHWIPFALSIMGAGITVGSMGLEGFLMVSGIVAGWGTVGYGVGRKIWTFSSRRWAGLLNRVKSRMLDMVQGRGLPSHSPANLLDEDSVGTGGHTLMLEEET